MITPSANDILTARMAGRSDAEHLEELDSLSRHLEAELHKTRIERDLAIAHDRQPYPTADAYEVTCKTLERKRQHINALRAVLLEIRNMTVKCELPLLVTIHEMADGALEL